ncbi:MAG: flagellar assembly protein FliW [Campylobacterales bacterium]
MVYELKSPILGFEDLDQVEFEELDESFAKIRSTSNSYIELTLVNPYSLREYSFDIPKYVQVLLDINENTNLLVYCVLIVQTPIDNSKVNFLAPIIFNKDNNRAAQIALSVKDYPHFKVADDLKNYMTETPNL